MITDEKSSLEIDVGLPVLYDGERNEILYNGRVLEYPAGAMIAEYARLHVKDIKPVILDCIHINDEPTLDNIELFVDDFQNKMMERFEPVAGAMAMIEIYQIVEDWIQAGMEGRSQDYVDYMKEMATYNEINEYIFAETGYQGLGDSTIGHLALSAYASFAPSFIHTTYTFKHIMKCAENEEDANDRALKLLNSLYTEMMSMQHIDFRIVNVEGRFRSHFVIKTSMSLLTFEFAHWLDKGVSYVKCANCGRYFIPDGRSDQIYCSYPSPQNKDKTCRDIGAQVKRANKEKNDVVTREYRKVYMRYKMLTKRHPERRDAIKRLDELTEGMRDWKEKLSNGTATADQFLEWIGQF